MLERDHAHVIASDAHGADGRPPDLYCALEALERRTRIRGRCSTG